MPLRASNINYNDLRHIIILGNERFISRWDIIWYPEIWLTLINARDLEMITLRTNNADIMVSTCTQPMTSIWQNLSKYLEMEISLSQDSNQSDVWKISPQLSDKRPSEVQYSHQGYIGEVWQQDSDKESFSSSWEQPLRPGWLVKKDVTARNIWDIFAFSKILTNPVVTLCREWSLLKNLPKISVLDGSPMSRADLRWNFIC